MSKSDVLEKMTGFYSSLFIQSIHVIHSYIYGTNHPQLKQSTRATRKIHACDTQKTRVTHAQSLHNNTRGITPCVYTRVVCCTRVYHACSSYAVHACTTRVVAVHGTRV